ncbi:MAG TPA: tetratricopeptide repeat protein [Gemmatimonadales bacterium]|nr:tetratricopeptide repeat protein [Gemmatimonadales bacterium]
MRKVAIFAGLTVMIIAATPRHALAQGWAEPKCDINASYFLVNSALLYLKHSATTGYVDQKKKDREDAKQVLLKAIAQGRTDDPAVWYYLARYYEYSGDAAGADSAWDKTLKLQPDCAKDIDMHRHNMWVPLFNGAIQQLRANNLDSAKALLNAANDVYTGKPEAVYYLAQIYANQGQLDTAAQHFAEALRIANDSANKSDTSFADIRSTSAYDLARIYQSLANKSRSAGAQASASGQPQVAQAAFARATAQYDSAINWYNTYRQVNANDVQALAGQATVYSHASAFAAERASVDSGAQAKADSTLAADYQTKATALYDTVLVRSDSIPVEDVFQAGVQMFQAQRYQSAIAAFNKGLARSPYQRDALYNLANAYLATSGTDTTLTKAQEAKREVDIGQKLESVAQRLIALDPANKTVRRLLATSFQLQHLDDSTISAVKFIRAMKYNVDIGRFHLTNQGADISGTITNITMDSSAVSVPTLSFEFLDAQGNVVATDSVAAQQLAKGASAPFSVKADGEKIVAWRYKPQS